MSNPAQIHSSFSIPSLKKGQRFTLPYHGNTADALFISSYLETQAQRPFAIICANSAETQRLAQEMHFFAPQLTLRILPDWETLPYDRFSPHQDLVSERLATLHELSTGQCDVLFISATTALHCLPPPEFLAAYIFFIDKATPLNLQQLREQLQLAGYEHVTQVVQPGEYTIRGSLIDLFPMGADEPYRIDLFDHEVDSIRAFDVETQRSTHVVEKIQLLPGHEFPTTEVARTEFRSRWREHFEGDPSRCSLYKEIGQGILPAGIEYYLPLFFEKTAHIFDYFPESTQLFLFGDIEQHIHQFLQDTQQRYRFLSHDPQRPILSPQHLFLSLEDFYVQCQAFTRLVFSTQQKTNWAQPLPDLTINHRREQPLAALQQLIATTDSRVLFVADSAGRKETILQLFAEHHIHPHLSANFETWCKETAPFSLTIAPLYQGFSVASAHITIITESDLYGTQTQPRRQRKQEKNSDVDALIRNLAELNLHDPVVHLQYGIGRYMGLVSMDLGEGETEFLQLEYQHQNKLYVPVSQLHVISRYHTNQADQVQLNTLGSGQWEKARKKAAQQIYDTAAELLNLYARRAIKKGYAFQINETAYARFAEGFDFEATPDQQAAIDAVKHDMRSPSQMDRLVCGDVGFGKTEVALRAAFIAAMDGKQVALLVPTTLLAEQHTQTFKDRFANWPIRIVELSRFRNTKEIKAAIEQIKEGTADIIIGTHRLISQDMQFKRLGLIMIDEEHRFGVRQKEFLKKMREEIDVLTLTATPIPRTLSMALEGLRDFSVIATAPQKRLAIKTFLHQEDKSTIREAVLRELKRGGQVYFLHNEVDTIEQRYAQLSELIPEARIDIAHGKMREQALEQVMRRFTTQQSNLLLCTTIIETGIDVPNANTIIIHRADKFGLAQLHQLRGRVGRSHHQAYAYLLIHDFDGLNKQAKQRLEAIQQMEELGSGFYLAMHDLEIRGTGEVLGDKQSGEIQTIGFQLYTDMLNQAIDTLKQGKEPDLAAPLSATIEVNLHGPALLPDDYCGSIQERLTLYKRMANCQTQTALTDLFEELIDRFGQPPLAARTLIETHRIKLLAQALGILKIDAHETAIHLHFSENPPIDPFHLIQMVQNTSNFQFNGADKLKITISAPDIKNRIALVKQIFQQLKS